MSKNSDTIGTNVVIVRDTNTADALVKCFDHLGGINKFIQENDIIFIKLSFKLPYGYPCSVNYDTLGKLIELCLDSGAKEIYVGDFPSDHIKFEVITDITGLKKYLESKGAVLANLDDEELFPRRQFSLDSKQIKIPSIILDADKLIILNQVNVDPIFICTLSYLNLSTIIPNKYQRIEKNERPGKDYLSLDQYKQDLISNILAISTIKTPNLVINDLTYVIEGAGPYTYKDSHCIETNLFIMGENTFAVDYITLKLMSIELSESKLLSEAQGHSTGILHPEYINLLGDSASDNKFKIQKCVSTLEDINVKNCLLRKGRYCSGCYEKAYHLLNFLKSAMTKDLKYMGSFSFLIGETPLEPDIKDNIILFGDCAIESTKDRDFRKKTLLKKQTNTKEIMKKIKKSQKKPSKSTKMKIVDNKNILELPGCPPDLIECYDFLIKYYSKTNLPNLNLLATINSSFIDNYK